MTQEQDAPPRGGRRDAVPVLYSRRVGGRLSGNRVNLRAVTFLGSALGLIALVGSLYLQQASRVAAYAHEIRQLEHQKEQLRSEIMVLRAECAALGSLARVTIMGEALGYFLPSSTDGAYRLQIEYVTEDPAGEAPRAPNARVQHSLAGVALEEPAPPEGGIFERLFADLQNWLENGPSDGALAEE